MLEQQIEQQSELLVLDAKFFNSLEKRRDKAFGFRDIFSAAAVFLDLTATATKFIICSHQSFWNILVLPEIFCLLLSYKPL